eukprot:g70472.t1
MTDAALGDVLEKLEDLGYSKLLLDQVEKGCKAGLSRHLMMMIDALLSDIAAFANSPRVQLPQQNQQAFLSALKSWLLQNGYVGSTDSFASSYLDRLFLLDFLVSEAMAVRILFLHKDQAATNTDDVKTPAPSKPSPSPSTISTSPAPPASASSVAASPSPSSPPAQEISAQ